MERTARRAWLRVAAHRSLAAAAGLAGLPAVHAQAQPQRWVRVAVENWSPWVDIDPSGPHFGGLALTLLSAVLQRMGLPVRYTPLPFKRALIELEAGNIDILPMLSYEADRMRYTAYSESIVEEEVLLCGLDRGASPKFEWRDWADLSTYTVAVTRGYGYGGQLTALRHHARSVVESASDVTSARLLAAGRVDLAALYKTTLPGFLRDVPELTRHLHCGHRPLLRMPLHYGIAKASRLSARLQEFNAQLAVVKAQPLFKKQLEEVAARP